MKEAGTSWKASSSCLSMMNGDVLYYNLIDERMILLFWMLIILFFIFPSNYTRYYLFKKLIIITCFIQSYGVVVGEQASYDAGQ